MTTPRLINAFDPETYTALVRKAVLTKSALFGSSAIQTNAEFNTLAGSSGTSVVMPHYDELDGTAEVGSRDASVPGTIGALKMGDTVAQKDFLSKAWGVSKLDAQLAGVENVLKADANRTAGFWARTFDKLALNKVNGVIKDSIENHNGDMVHDITEDSTDPVADAEKASVGAIIDTQLTMGDRFDELALWIFPTAVYGSLLKQDVTNFQQPSATNPFLTYRGLPVIVSDSLAPETVGTRKVYTSYLLGAGALQFGSKVGLGGENVIVENHYAGRNMGSTDLITRQPGFIFHIGGYTSQAPIDAADAGPAPAAYNDADAWERVYDRKHIRIAALKSNG